MTRRKLFVFATLAMTVGLVAVLGMLFIADLYAHSRVERSVGVNRHGYRGSVAAAKAPGSRRIVMLGGSTVFGWDVAVDDTIPAILERLLQSRAPGTSVINLGFIGEGAHAFLPTLQDFESLDYDVVCLYEGYNDLAGDARPNTDLVRHSSAVFRATGYFPILPLFLREKAFALRFGTVGAAYETANGEKKTVFRPGLANRTTAAALSAAAAVTSSLGEQLNRLAAASIDVAADGNAECAPPWSHYCRAVSAAVDYAVAKGKSTLVILQPSLKKTDSDRPILHAQQEFALGRMVRQRYASEPRVRLVDLSSAVDLANQELAFDGMHLNAAGNTIIATALVGPVFDAAGLSRVSR